MSIDTQEKQIPYQIEERRSERRRNIDTRVQATVDWILTLDEKVESGQIKPQERAELISRSLVSRELLLERTSEQRERVIQRAQSAEQLAQSETERANKDPRTGLLNVGMFEAEYAALQQSGQNFGLLILDIDHFKEVNDKWGHSIGNRVLIQTARNIVANVRQIRSDEEENDKVFRYGGEEIAVLLPGVTNKVDLEVIAEKLREAVGGSPYVVRRSKSDLHIPITVTIGGGIFKPGYKGGEFFDKVDGAMYEGKKQGRNKSNILPD